MTDLDRTEATYKERGNPQKKGVTPSSLQAINIFFDDIRFEYHEALKSIGNVSALQHHTGARVILVSSSLAGSVAHLNPSEAVLKSILHAAKAYDILASSGQETFTLEVSSTPDHATVSYWQRLSPDIKTLDHKTNWQIPNLSHATYSIRFQKLGCEEQTIAFEGGETKSTSVHVDLVCKGRAR
jgi:hypothetical protein